MKRNSARSLQAAPFFAVAVLSLLAGASARANDYVIYVAPGGTPAETSAQGKADGNATFAERSAQKAFDKAGQLLSQDGAHSVSVLMAGGDYAGKAGGGMYFVPQIKNPRGVLRIIGGFAPDFSGRQPFKYLTRLTTNEGRNQGILNISKQSQLQELVVSALLLDAAQSNDYDKKTTAFSKAVRARFLC